jgi:hypothetical protein
VPSTDAPYPSEWLRSLDDAVDAVRFDPILPDDAAANPHNVEATFVFPGGEAIALDFALSADPKRYVRQGYLEVWESPWDLGDPRAFFKEDLEASAIEGAYLVDLSGHTALAVPANSPSDDSRSNAAFVRLEVRGLDVQVSGGDDLELILRIADSIADQDRVA